MLYSCHKSEPNCAWSRMRANGGAYFGKDALYRFERLLGSCEQRFCIFRRVGMQGGKVNRRSLMYVFNG